MEVALLCLAQALYFEARSEPIAEQLMVANVIMNRVDSDRYPDDICEVVEQPKQFSYLSDGKSEKIHNLTAWNTAMYWADWYLKNPYKYHNGCHYHANYVNPNWGYTLVYKGKTHLFYEGGC